MSFTSRTSSLPKLTIAVALVTMLLLPTVVHADPPTASTDPWNTFTPSISQASVTNFVSFWKQLMISNAVYGNFSAYVSGNQPQIDAWMLDNGYTALDYSTKAYLIDQLWSSLPIPTLALMTATEKDNLRAMTYLAIFDHKALTDALAQKGQDKATPQDVVSNSTLDQVLDTLRNTTPVDTPTVPSLPTNLTPPTPVVTDAIQALTSIVGNTIRDSTYGILLGEAVTHVRVEANSPASLRSRSSWAQASGPPMPEAQDEQSGGASPGTIAS